MEQVFQTLEKVKEVLFVQTKNKIELYYEKYPVHLQGKKNSTTYELCLKTEDIPHFKYRFMFIEYLENDFPILLDIDEDIAVQLKINHSMFCNTAEELEMILQKIENSEKFKRVIKKLM